MSAVIYAAIVVMWAVVLVPMWLRRHDAATESRSVDRFSTAMRTLSRRTSATPGRRYVVMPRRSERGPTVHVSGAAAARPPRRSGPRRSGRRRTAPSGERLSLIARRRRLMLGLLAVTFLTFVLAAAGVLSWLLQIVVDVVLIAFCAHLRAQARRAATVARRRRSVAVETAVPASAGTRPSIASPGAPAAPVAPAMPVAPQVPVESPAAFAAAWVSASEASSPAVMADEIDVDVDGVDTWEPVPVPRPTYTMKPPAPAYEADPTYEPPTYQPDARPAEPATAADPAAASAAAAGSGSGRESDLDEILERRWAVND